MDQDTGEEGFVSLLAESISRVLRAKGGYARGKIRRRFGKPPRGGKGKGRRNGRRPGFASRRGDGAGFPITQAFMEKVKKARTVGGKGSKERMLSKVSESKEEPTAEKVKRNHQRFQ